MFVGTIAYIYLVGKKELCIGDYGEGRKKTFYIIIHQQVARMVFLVKTMRQEPEKNGKVKWNLIINFILFQIATKKHPHGFDTQPQMAGGCFFWQHKYDCGPLLNNFLPFCYFPIPSEIIRKPEGWLAVVKN